MGGAMYWPWRGISSSVRPHDITTAPRVAPCGLPGDMGKRVGISSKSSMGTRAGMSSKSSMGAAASVSLVGMWRALGSGMSCAR